MKQIPLSSPSILVIFSLILFATPQLAQASFWQTKLTPSIEWFELSPKRNGLGDYSAEPSDWRMNLGLTLNRDHLYYGYQLSTFYYLGKDSSSNSDNAVLRDTRFQAYFYQKHDLVPGLKLLAGARFRQTRLTPNLQLSDAYDVFAGGMLDYTLSENWRSSALATLGVPENLDSLNWRTELQLNRRINDQSSIGLAVKTGKLYYDELPTTYHSISVLYHTSL